MLDNMKCYTLYHYKASTPEKKRSHVKEGFIFKDNDGNIFEIGKGNSRKFNKKLDIIFLEEAIHDDITGFELDKYNSTDLPFQYCIRKENQKLVVGTTKVLNSTNKNLSVCLVKSTVTSYERLGYMLLYNQLNHSSSSDWMYYDPIVKEFRVLDPSLFVIKWATLNDHAVWFRPFMEIPIMQSKDMSDIYQNIEVSEDSTE